MTRWLGVDLGGRRVGLAIAAADDEPTRALVTLRRASTVEGDVAALRRIVEQHAIESLVVGLPIDMSGGEGHQARRTRDWVEAIGPALGLPIILRDERLTSHLAETRVGPMPRGRSGGPPTAAQRERYRSRIDREAAAIILQDELDARGVVTSRPTTPPEPHR